VMDDVADARHVKRWHLSKETRVRTAVNGVAGTIAGWHLTQGTTLRIVLNDFRGAHMISQVKSQRGTYSKKRGSQPSPANDGDVVVHSPLHHVAAQVEIESKVLKRSIISQFQAMRSRRFQRGFDRVHLHRPTIIVPLFMISRGRSLGTQGPVSNSPVNGSNMW